MNTYRPSRATPAEIRALDFGLLACPASYPCHQKAQYKVSHTNATRRSASRPTQNRHKSYYIGIPTLSHEMARRKERRLRAIHDNLISSDSESLVIFVVVER